MRRLNALDFAAYSSPLGQLRLVQPTLHQHPPWSSAPYFHLIPMLTRIINLSSVKW